MLIRYTYNMTDYHYKYLKYKSKYLQLVGGSYIWQNLIDPKIIKNEQQIFDLCKQFKDLYGSLKSGQYPDGLTKVQQEQFDKARKLCDSYFTSTEVKME